MYVPALNIVLLTFSPAMSRALIGAGLATTEFPHRKGGYRTYDERDDGGRLYRSLQVKADKLARRYAVCR